MKKGYTKLSNEILEALAKIRISGESVQVFWVIMRLTYGWNRTWANIKIGEISERTGLPKPNVSRSLKKLALMQLIIIKKDNAIVKIDNRLGSKYRINKNYDAWKTPKKVTRGIIKIDNKPLSKLITNVIKIDNSKPLQAVDSAAHSVPKEKKDILKDKRIKSCATSVATPGDISRKFFAMHIGEIERDETYSKIRGKMPVEEVDNFVLYWTEPTKSGKRERWETERTFEITRRIATWLRRSEQRMKKSPAPKLMTREEIIALGDK